jgi:hypothetical protein
VLAIVYRLPRRIARPLVLAAAEKQADRRPIARVLQQVIDHGQIEVELTNEGRLERYGFQLDDDELRSFR